MRWPLVFVMVCSLFGQALAQDPKVAFFKALHEGDLSEVRRMAEQDPSLVNSDLGRGIRPLYRAAAMNRPEMVTLLLELGSELEAPTPQGNTAVFAAAAGGHLTILEMLLARGARLDTRDQDGVTPLLASVERRHLGITRRLLAAGADVHQADDEGRTPLHQAAAEGLTGEVKLLLAAGALPQAKDRHGLTPSDWARQRLRGDYRGVLELLGAPL